MKREYDIKNYIKIKLWKPNRWWRCINCGYEFKKEIGWKYKYYTCQESSDIDYICIHCASNESIAKEIIIKKHDIKNYVKS